MGIFDKLKNIFSKEDTSKYNEGLKKSKSSMGEALFKLSSKYKKIDNEYFEELEEILITSDVGVNMVMDLIDKLKLRVAKEQINDIEMMNEIIVDELFLIYVGEEVIDSKISFNSNGLTVVLVVGVNGVGKTTAIGKLAHKYTQEGMKVCLAAGDTFRAGAIKQLELWGEKTGADVISGVEGGDPSSVMYDALAVAKDKGYDLLICDTAGRLQNKENLMKELAKIKRVIGREVENAPHETLLVLDATTGQNGISQAKAFTETTDVSGIVLTKLDGTSKGGIVLAIKEHLNIPVKFIGVGEKADDLELFDIEKYIYSLFGDFM